METRIHEALNETYQNYILPFFWQHGETETVLRTYMKTIQDMGIQAVCLESRPHPDFAGPGWWHDLDIILDEAKQRNMKVWILVTVIFLPATQTVEGKKWEKNCKSAQSIISV